VRADQRRGRERCSRLSAAGSRAASRRDSQLPGVLALYRIGGVPEGCGEAIRRQLRVVGQNLLLRGSACGELEQEFDAEASTANARLAVEKLGLATIRSSAMRACLWVHSSCLGNRPMPTRGESPAGFSRLHHQKAPHGSARPDDRKH
jgi:hypothetical protein